MNVPWCEMENVEECCDGIASHLANLGLVHEGIVKQRSGVLLLLTARITTSIFTIGVLLRRYARNVEAHLDQLISAGASLLSLAPGATKVAICAGIVGVDGQSHFDSNLIATSQVGVANLRIRDLESRAILDVECELGLGEFGLAPIPTPQGMLFVLEDRAVPVLEDLGEAVKVLLLEAVELDDGGRVALQDADLVALGGAAPVGAANVSVVEGKGVAAASGLPAEAVLGESAFAALLGEVEIDVVKALAVREFAHRSAMTICDACEDGMRSRKPVSRAFLLGLVLQGLGKNSHCRHLGYLKALMRWTTKRDEEIE
jgi:hypothetical protein